MKKGSNRQSYNLEKANFQYYVEGEDEKKLLNVLKRDMHCIESGKVDKFNVIQNRFTITRIRTLKQNTSVILVYDTDIEKTDILQDNLDFLEKQTVVKDVICIPQVKNLEDELVRSCQIKKIEELTHSGSKKDYKHDLICCTNLKDRLEKCGFDISKFWCCIPQNSFQVYGNQADKIRL